MLELLPFLLLPAAAATGWFAARRQDRQRRARATSLSSSYFRGLNHLLNEEPDKAIELFTQLADINRDTVETHLALGKLFRRRGEMDKAIHFHKHIITRPNLTEDQRTQALLELGQDYMRAGLLDRAERLFSELLEHDPQAEVPIRQLLDIYQQEKDWEKAIERARQLRLPGDTGGKLVAQFYCELAQKALEQEAFDEARQLLRQGRRQDPRSPRPRLLEGDLAWRTGDIAGAARHYQEACELNCDCSLAVLDRIVDAHRQLGRLQELEAWLRAQVEGSGMTTPVLALSHLIAERDPAEAIEFLLGRLSLRPTVRGLEYLMELAPRAGVSLDDIGPDLIRTLMQRLLDGQPRYRCQHCGFSGSTYHWLCPSCRRWNTTRAIGGVLGE